MKTTTQTQTTMTVAELALGELLVVHPAGTTVRAGHAAAKAIKGVRIRETFVDGWGRTVSMGVASNL